MGVYLWTGISRCDLQNKKWEYKVVVIFILWTFGSNYMLFNICDSVLTCCFAPCGWLLASGDSGGEIIIWDIHAGNHLYCKTAHDMGVNCILFSTKWDPNQGQHTMISAGSDCMIYLWNITTNASKWWCLSCLLS